MKKLGLIEHYSHPTKDPGVLENTDATPAFRLTRPENRYSWITEVRVIAIKAVLISSASLNLLIPGNQKTLL
jgi:hypothetical protein